MVLTKSEIDVLERCIARPIEKSPKKKRPKEPLNKHEWALDVTLEGAAHKLRLLFVGREDITDGPEITVGVDPSCISPLFDAWSVRWEAQSGALPQSVPGCPDGCR